MLSYLWAGMILLGILYGTFAGTIPDITAAALDSAKEAIALCITMLGVMSFWMGFMEIATQAGIIKAAARYMRPVMHFLFPRVPEESAAYEHMTTNIIANVLGLGWAATPAGLKAMQGLDKLQQARQGKEVSNERKVQGNGVASDEMCTFLVLNISSLQLIPINIIAYRTQYGSVNPTAIIGPGIIATVFSTLVGVLFCKMMCCRK